MSDSGIPLEDLDSKFDAVIDLVTQMNDTVKLLAKQEDLKEVKTDIKIIKAAVTDTNKQVANHEVRITTLETA